MAVPWHVRVTLPGCPLGAECMCPQEPPLGCTIPSFMPLSLSKPGAPGSHFAGLYLHWTLESPQGMHPPLFLFQSLPQSPAHCGFSQHTRCEAELRQVFS